MFGDLLSENAAERMEDIWQSHDRVRQQVVDAGYAPVSDAPADAETAELSVKSGEAAKQRLETLAVQAGVLANTNN